MPYQKPGLRIREDGFVYPEIGRFLASLPTLEKIVKSGFEKLGRPSRRLNNIAIEDIIAMGLSDETKDFPDATKIEKSLQILLAATLHRAGYLDCEIQRVWYRSNPILTVDEAATLCMTPFIMWPSREMLGGDFATLESLQAIFVRQIRDLDFISRLHLVMVARLRSKVEDVAAKVYLGLPIEQAERSMFLAWRNTSPGSYGHSRHDEGQTQYPTLITSLGNLSSGYKLRAVENSDTKVTEAYQFMKQYTDQGPFFNYYKLLSNNQLENELLWFGPHVNLLSARIGYMQKFGHFAKPILKTGYERSWSEEDPLDAIRDNLAGMRAGGLTNGAMGLGTRPPFLEHNDIRVLEDLPDLQMRLLDQEDIRHVEFSYHSAWQNRTVFSTSYGISVLPGVFADLGLKNKRVGDTQLAPDPLNEDGLFEFEEQDGKAMIDKFVINRSQSMEDRILLPFVDVLRDSPEVRKYDVTPLIQRGGNLIIRPPLTEYCKPPLQWLYEANAPLEAYVHARMGHNKEQRLRAELPIRLQVNAAALGMWLGIDTKKPIMTMAYALMGQQKDTTALQASYENALQQVIKGEM